MFYKIGYVIKAINKINLLTFFRTFLFVQNGFLAPAILCLYYLKNDLKSISGQCYCSAVILSFGFLNSKALRHLTDTESSRIAQPARFCFHTSEEYGSINNSGKISASIYTIKLRLINRNHPHKGYISNI